MAAFFTIAKKLEKTKCPSAGKWMNKLWYSHMMEYYLARKRDGVSTQATAWMSYRIITVSKKSQSRKNTYESIYVKYPEKANRKR